MTDHSHHIIGSEAFTPRHLHHPAHGSLRAFVNRKDLGPIILAVAVGFAAGVGAFVWTVS